MAKVAGEGSEKILRAMLWNVLTLSTKTGLWRVRPSLVLTKQHLERLHYRAREVIMGRLQRCKTTSTPG